MNFKTKKLSCPLAQPLPYRDFEGMILVKCLLPKDNCLELFRIRLHVVPRESLITFFLKCGLQSGKNRVQEGNHINTCTVKSVIWFIK